MDEKETDLPVKPSDELRVEQAARTTHSTLRLSAPVTVWPPQYRIGDKAAKTTDGIDFFWCCFCSAHGAEQQLAFRPDAWPDDDGREGINGICETCARRAVAAFDSTERAVSRSALASMRELLTKAGLTLDHSGYEGVEPERPDNINVKAYVEVWKKGDRTFRAEAATQLEALAKILVKADQ